MNKKILFFGDLPPDYLDGISISSQINLELLKDHSETTIVAEENDFSKHGKSSLGKISHIIKKNKEVLNHFRKNNFDFFYLTYSLSTFGALKTLCLLLIAKIFSSATIVLHVHRGDFFLSFYQSILNRITTKLVFRLADKIIVLSNQQKEEFQDKLGVNKFNVLENTVREEHLFDKKNNNEVKTFLFVSNYLLEKGILDLLDVFKDLANDQISVKLITFGRFTDEEMKKKICSYRSDSIEINETIRGKEKFKMMSDVDCLILPSWNEGQPLTILEAFSVKTPVIVSSVGLVPEMVGEKYPYLFTSKNKSELKQAILNFMKDPKTADLGNKLNQKYIQEYSRMAHQSKLLDIFK